MILEATIIIVGIVLIGLLFIKISHAEKKIKLIVIALIFLFVVASASAVLKNNQININSLSGISQATSIYLGWLGNLGKSAFEIGEGTIRLTANAIKGNITEIK